MSCSCCMRLRGPAGQWCAWVCAGPVLRVCWEFPAGVLVLTCCFQRLPEALLGTGVCLGL
jgi:hypothetical protein